MRIFLLITIVLSIVLSTSFALYTNELKSNDNNNNNGVYIADNEYIVIMKKHITDDMFNKRMNDIKNKYGDNMEILKQYSFNNFHGYAARIPIDLLQSEMKSDDVEYIEKNQIATITSNNDACVSQTNDVDWGIARLNHRSSSTLDEYHHSLTAGIDVNAYVVDTGIYIDNVDFGGRAFWGTNCVDHDNTDGNGHGTHVAGTISGSLYGVSKVASLIAVKVLSATGSGSYAGVIEGVLWCAQHKQQDGRPGLANMSLGGPKSQALDDAIKEATDAGVLFVVAAGNSDDDACKHCPADSPDALTVGSTTRQPSGTSQEDARSYFSNYGKCVDIFAPGSDIKSDWIGNIHATNTISGTSMASPHVAGAGVLYLSQNPNATPAEVKQYLIENATEGVIDFDCTGSCSNDSPNKLLYANCA